MSAGLCQPGNDADQFPTLTTGGGQRLCQTDGRDQQVPAWKGTDVAGNSVAGDQAAALAHAGDHGAAHGGGHDEPITSPDQHKPMISPRLARLGAILTIIILPVLAFVGNHRGNVEKIWLVGIAGIMLLMLIVDAVLRKLGLRN